MTEAEWLDSTDPTRMLEFLLARGKLAERKARLFACACVRHVWSLLLDGRSERCVLVAEQYVDGQVAAHALRKPREQAYYVSGRAFENQWFGVSFRYGDGVRLITPEQQYAAYLAACTADLRKTAQRVASAVTSGEPWAVPLAIPYVALLRDIFNPFRPRQPVNPCGLQWNDACVLKLATAAYEERAMPEGTLDPQRLAVLADAMEGTGVTDPDILGHLREPGLVHVRGCFAVDLALGRS